ncbi:S9 family peptidase, partial [Streptomyces sp. SID11233]|nr:S9 family peptidase [Streptomyces sp. SID11233]
RVAEAKTRIGWIDEDTVLVGTGLAGGSLTDSGYARTVRRWRRGTPLGEAVVVYEAERSDIVAWGWHDHTPGFARDFVGRAIDFFTSESYLLTPGDTLVKIEVPDDATAYAHREHLLVTLRSDWLGHPAGALLAFGFDAFLAGDRTARVLFAPDARTALV